jgi:uroporphyrinogen decarboxylase
MTSRERVRRTLEFDRPDHVPRDLWPLPIVEIEQGKENVDAFRGRWPIDFSSPPAPPLPRIKGDMYGIGQYTDEWGCVFENIQRGVIGEVKAPILDDWSKLPSIRPPVEILDLDRAQINAACRASEKFMLSPCYVRPFERIQFLRGTENVYCDLAEDSSEFHALLKLVHEFNVKTLEAWAATEVDGLSIMDDWGSQRALLIDPATWRRIFKPLYAEYVRIAHDHGKKFFMHSDGYIFEIYDDLIEIGVDAINSQLFCMNIEDIGRRFKGRITFWGEMDRQHVLPHGTIAEARAATRRVIDALYDPRGGVIAQFELTSKARLENADAVFEEWAKLGS